MTACESSFSCVFLPRGLCVSAVLTFDFIAFCVDLWTAEAGEFSTLEKVATNDFCPLRLCDLCVFNAFWLRPQAAPGRSHFAKPPR